MQTKDESNRTGSRPCSGQVSYTIGFPLVNEDLAKVELAVKSIYAQSNQDWELIFFCDGSSREHVAKLSQIDDVRVRVVVNEQSSGIARSLNRLANMAKGKFIAILAADDLWPINRLELQLERMQSDNPPDVLAGQMLIISDDYEIEGAQRKAVIPKGPEGWVSGTPISHATAIATAQWLRRHPYDETLIRAQDRAFWITSSGSSTIEIMDEVLYYYRVPKPINYKKYAWSSRYARNVIWKYGPTIIPRAQVVKIYLGSLIKQAMTGLSVAIGGAEQLYNRRIEPITEEQRKRRLQELKQIAATAVPGW